MIIMSLWKRLFNALGFRPPSKRTYELDEDWINVVQVRRGVEKDSEDENAVGLLSSALAGSEVANEIELRWYSLSEREMEVVSLVCQNYTNRQIAEQLVISPETVKAHVRNALRKFNLHSKSELRLLLSGWDFRPWEN